ncbi:MAG: prephenate dehydratase domain-containing protein [Candidatus Baltobacteraceae bacterium]
MPAQHLRVAYQGEPGAFSDDAARTLVPGAETVGHGTFDDAATAAQHGETEFALLPVENSISGAVPRVYDLLWDDPRLAIVDEIVYRVVQNLIGLPAATIEGIREVHSHPVALEQCRHFLGEHPHMRSVIVADTAGAVREIARLGDPSIAAIGSALAAERYGARILAPSIQDVDANFTRFFLLQRDGAPRNEPSRACVAFTLPHRPGSLRDALAAFADHDLNLRTLASRPSLEGPFTYRFYLEVAPVKRAGLEAALQRLDGQARVLGFY